MIFQDDIIVAIPPKILEKKSFLRSKKGALGEPGRPILAADSPSTTAKGALYRSPTRGGRVGETRLNGVFSTAPKRHQTHIEKGNYVRA